MNTGQCHCVDSGEGHAACVVLITSTTAEVGWARIDGGERSEAPSHIDDSRREPKHC
jgi:hypothetical protein